MKKISITILTIIFILILCACQQENAKVPFTKDEEDFYKVINIMDYFKTAEGTYSFQEEVGKEVGKVDFYIDLENSRVLIYKKSNIEETTYVKNNGISYTIDETKKEYQKNASMDIDTTQDNEFKNMTFEERMSTPGTQRLREELMLAGSPFYFQEEMFNSIGIKDTKLITDEFFLGREAVVYEGTVHNTSKGVLVENSFQITIDKATGILLEIRFYLDDQLTREYIMTSLIVNELIDSSIFKFDFTGYQEVTVEERIQEAIEK